MRIAMRRAVTSHVSNWRSIYRYSGGLTSVIRLLLGTAKAHIGAYRQSNDETQVDCITFSVVPELTALWTVFLQSAIIPLSGRIVIGDSSGGFRYPNYSDNRPVVVPILNYPHGYKIDLFLRQVCQAKYVFISDDDVFLLTSYPLQWAIEQLEKNPCTAAVSLKPRERTTDVVEGEVKQLMGSYCLLVRRDIWLEEDLSFQIKEPEVDTYSWFFDTGDLAHVELLRRGYEVLIAPNKVRTYLTGFSSVSTWVLKMNKYQTRMGTTLQLPLHAEKVYRTVLIVESLNMLLLDYYPGWPRRAVVTSNILEQARRESTARLGVQQIQSIQEEVQKTVKVLEKHLGNIKFHRKDLGFSSKNNGKHENLL